MKERTWALIACIGFVRKCKEEKKEKEEFAWLGFGVWAGLLDLKQEKNNHEKIKWKWSWTWPS